jgi:hypothetical protein
MNPINEKLDDLSELNSDMSDVDQSIEKPKRGRPKAPPKEATPNGRKVRSEKQIEAWNKALAKTEERRVIVRLAKEEKMAEIYINKKNRENTENKKIVEEDDIETSSDESIEISSRKTKVKQKHKKKNIVVAPPKQQKVKKLVEKYIIQVQVIVIVIAMIVRPKVKVV